MGEPLQEGDLVLRAIHSRYSLHTIVRFTNNNIVLSCQRGTNTYRDWRGIERTWSYMMYSTTVEQHNDTFYYSKAMAPYGLIKYRRYDSERISD